LEDKRSNLIKEACRTVSTIAMKLDILFEPLAPIFLSALFKLLIITIKVIADSAHNCILSFLPFANSSIPLVVQGISDQHPVLRGKCAEYLLQILQKK